MLSINKVMLAGNLTRDPEKRATASGLSICEFGLAVNRKMKDKNETCFVNVSVFGKQAEACAQYLRKGSAVYVEGRLQYEQWEDRSGAKRSALKVSADAVQFISGRNGSDGGYEENDGQPPPRNENPSGHRYGREYCPIERPVESGNSTEELPPF